MYEFYWQKYNSFLYGETMITFNQNENFIHIDYHKLSKYIQELRINLIKKEATDTQHIGFEYLFHDKNIVKFNSSEPDKWNKVKVLYDEHQEFSKKCDAECFNEIETYRKTLNHETTERPKIINFCIFAIKCYEVELKKHKKLMDYHHKFIETSNRIFYET